MDSHSETFTVRKSEADNGSAIRRYQLISPLFDPFGRQHGRVHEDRAQATITARKPSLAPVRHAMSIFIPAITTLPTLPNAAARPVASRCFPRHCRNRKQDVSCAGFIPARCDAEWESIISVRRDGSRLDAVNADSVRFSGLNRAGARRFSPVVAIPGHFLF